MSLSKALMQISFINWNGNKTLDGNYIFIIDKNKIRFIYFHHLTTAYKTKHHEQTNCLLWTGLQYL